MTRSGESADTQPGALGGFLRAIREARHPEDFALPRGPRRRTRGLRREEVSALCGVSPTWYTWIEQGRTTAVSVSTLAAFAQGLHLSPAERAYLFRLAGRADPAPADAGDVTPAPMQALVDAISSPAYVLDRHWDAIAWNATAAQLFRGWLGPSAARRKQQPTAGPPNLLRYVFLDPGAPHFIVDWEVRAARLVAEYRADIAGPHPGARQQALVEELRRASPVFDRAWRSQKVLAREGGSRAFVVSKQGQRRYWQFTLRLAQQNDIKLVVLHEQ
jgi:transcriptional regulator with XRE-family HTH domain